MKGFLSEERPIRTLREVLNRLRESYCGKIGYEVRTQVGWPALSACCTMLHSSCKKAFLKLRESAGARWEGGFFFSMSLSWHACLGMNTGKGSQ